MAPSRSGILAAASTVVVKVGTNVLTNLEGVLDRGRVQSLADQLHRLIRSGRRVVLVTSGAIGAGIGRLNLGKRPTDLPHLQACAAVGQSALMQAYQESLTPYGIHAAQVLLTAGDFDHRTRCLNVRNTLRTLFEYSCLPIINENDTVSVAEIRFGDNDALASMVACLLRAPMLILLTNVDGLYSADPGVDPTATRVSTVERIGREIAGMAGATKSRLGTGGMSSKLRAARIASSAGVAVVMADGSVDGIVDRIFADEDVGTLFLPQVERTTSRKRWLGYMARPKGHFKVNAGAEEAIRHKGRSLLPVGVVSVEGAFQRGDVVGLLDAEGQEFARGLCNYSSADADRLRGLNSEQIARVVGPMLYAELIHRDHLVVLE